jgi:hypothetical protein
MGLENSRIPQWSTETRAQVTLKLPNTVVECRICDLNAGTQRLPPVAEVHCQRSSSCSHKQFVIVIHWAKTIKTHLRSNRAFSTWCRSSAVSEKWPSSPPSDMTIIFLFGLAGLTDVLYFVYVPISTCLDSSVVSVMISVWWCNLLFEGSNPLLSDIFLPPPWGWIRLNLPSTGCKIFIMPF